MSAMDMEIDEPGRQVKILRVDIFVCRNSAILADAGDSARLEADPSVIQYLILKDYAGIVNARHQIPLVWSDLPCKLRI